MAERIRLLIEYGDPHSLGQAVARLRRTGHGELEIYSPIPVDPGGYPAPRHRWLDVSGLTGALAGLALGVAITVGQNVGQYPLNVGGRPLFSWPGFLVPAFELAVLFGSIGAAIGFLAVAGLPRLHNPLFDADVFERASEDRFFVTVATQTPATVRQELDNAVPPLSIREIGP